MTEDVIRFENVGIRLGERNVLDGMTFSVRKGETFVIVGPSGTGKSVTLSHIVGLLRPDTGRVVVLGEDVSALDRTALSHLRSRIGMLFQSGALLNWMNVYDNIALPLRERFSMDEKQIRGKISGIMSFLEIAGAARKMPDMISGGMKKRAGLARALVCDPEIMLFDEPTSGLDPVMSRKIDALVKSLKDRMRMTSVVVTHDLCSAFSIADRIAMISDGKVVECAAPPLFRKSANPLVREFIEAQFAGTTGFKGDSVP